MDSKCLILINTLGGQHLPHIHACLEATVLDVKGIYIPYLCMFVVLCRGHFLAELQGECVSSCLKYRRILL